MVRYVWLAMLGLLALATAEPRTYAADAASADEQAISKIEHEWLEALKTRNKAFFEKYLSDDFTYINENGQLSSGPAFVDGITSNVQVALSDQKIRVHGTTGVSTGRFTVKDSTGVSSSTRYTNVFAKGPDGWKAIALQETIAE